MQDHKHVARQRWANRKYRDYGSLLNVIEVVLEPRNLHLHSRLDKIEMAEIGK
jgi:hypothetical protein